jgi:hypothetical protein
MGSAVAETIITVMKLDVANYIAGGQQILAMDAQLIASNAKVIASFQRLQAAINASVGGSGGSGGSGGGGGMGRSGGSGGGGSSSGFGGYWPTGGGSSGGGSGGSGAIVPGSGGSSSIVPLGGGGSGGGGTSFTPRQNFGGGSGPNFWMKDRGPLGKVNPAALFGAFYIGMRIIRDVVHEVEELDKTLLKTSIDAVKEYAGFKTIELSFEGMYGSAQKANQMMTYLRNTAMGAAFYFKDLAAASRSISVAGLDVNRFLPITQGFSLAMGKYGDSGGEGMQDFIGILRRIVGGNTGVALGPRGIGRYGVSREELAGAGAKFDAHGHFIGSVNEAFDAIEKVFTTRIKGIADKVASSPDVQLTDWKDAVDQAMIDFGGGLMTEVVGPLKDATGVLTTLRQSGVFTDFGKSLAGLFTGLIPSGGAAEFHFTEKKGESAADRKKRLEHELDAYATNRFTGFGPKGLGKPGSGSIQTTGDPMSDALINIGALIINLIDIEKNAMLSLVHIIPQLLGGILGGVVALTPWNGIGAAAAKAAIGFELGSGAAYSIWNSDNNTDPFGVDNTDTPGGRFKQKAMSDYYKNWRKGAAGGAATAPMAPAGTGLPGVDFDSGPDGAKAANRYLKDIREHTGNISKALEAGHAFGGGGRIGETGITKTELSNYRLHGRGRGGSGVATAMSDLGQKIEDYVADSINSAFAHGLRQNYFGNGN